MRIVERTLHEAEKRGFKHASTVWALMRRNDIPRRLVNLIDEAVELIPNELQAEIMKSINQPSEDEAVSIPLVTAMKHPVSYEPEINPRFLPPGPDGVDPRFGGAGNKLQRIVEAEGKDAIHKPEHAHLFSQTMRFAPKDLQTPEAGAEYDDSNRLLSTAAGIANVLAQTHATVDAAEGQLYDIAAIAKAALMHSDEVPSRERKRLLTEVGDVLADLLKDETSRGINGFIVGHQPVHQTPNKKAVVTQDVSSLLHAIPDAHTLINEAFNVIDASALPNEDDAVWGLTSLMERLEGLFKKEAGNETPWENSTTSYLSPEIAKVIAVLDDINDRLGCMLLCASLTVLTVSKDMLDDAVNRAVEARKMRVFE